MKVITAAVLRANVSAHREGCVKIYFHSMQTLLKENRRLHDHLDKADSALSSLRVQADTLEQQAVAMDARRARLVRIKHNLQRARSSPN